MSKILEVLDPEAGFGIDAIGDQTVDKGSDGGKLYLDTSSFEITLSYLIIMLYQYIIMMTTAGQS